MGGDGVGPPGPPGGFVIGVGKKIPNTPCRGARGMHFIFLLTLMRGCPLDEVVVT